jgi:hypothetical protein
MLQLASFLSERPIDFEPEEFEVFLLHIEQRRNMQALDDSLRKLFVVSQ